jgi:2-polyprenyl-6-methoxyphenol hydroxylase-like FAD-dependent oxidoreductase
MTCDALIVGAGPVGLTLAGELGRYGLRVRIVDKASHPSDKSKALVVWSRTLELMARLGCTQAFLARGLKATGARITAGKNEIGHVTLDKIPTPYPYALVIPQSETERLLEKHLASFALKVEREVEWLQFSNSANGVISKVRHANGREESIESRWLVGCDGPHSAVRHQLALPFHGDTLSSDWLLADVHLNNVPHPTEIQLNWHADGVLAIFPITETRFRVIADTGNNLTDAPRPAPTLEEVQTVIDQRGMAGIKATEPVWLASFRINERKVKDYRVGRVFLAGDAAHIHSPAGGQGMNTGMQDAFNLAWKFALVHRGECEEEPLLGSYSTERSAIGEQILAGTGRLTSVAILKGGIKQSIRNHIAELLFGLAPVRKMVAETLSELSIGYPKNPLSIKGGTLKGGPAPGQRGPLRENELPVGSGNLPRFALFADDDADAKTLIAKYSDLLEQQVRKPFQPGGLWLVRPDGYVAVATAQHDYARVSSFFDTLGAKQRKYE